MRLFIAIEISDEIREALAQIQSRLKYAGADVKWVEPKNIHLTLKFLGEVKEEKVEEIKSALNETVKGFKPFELSIKDIGAFPKIDFPRVIWAGLDKGTSESKALAEAIDERLSRHGFEKESRPFASHLTIGRVRSPKNKAALKERLLSSNLPLTPYHLPLIPYITLYKSTLTPHGSIYTKLHEAKLSG